MFTGLIREIADGRVQNDKLMINAKYKPSIGDSIAVNGACLSVVNINESGFEVELSHESKSIIALENYNGKVHIEPAMKLSDRIEGHILQGHIDTLGTIKKMEKKDGNLDLYINVPKEFIKFIVPKGSIAVDGVSLTINDVYNDSFRLTIIPITVQNTLIKEYKLGRKVNIETDMFARYIYHIFKKEKNLSWDEVDRINAIF